MLTHSFSSSSPTELLASDNTLAVISFSKTCEPSELGVIYPGIEEVSTQQVSEVWSVSEKVTRGKSGKSYWSKTSELICITYWLNEEDCRQLEQSTYEAYLSLLSVLKDHGIFYPFRFWNYVPDINKGKGDEEIYKRFCNGRLKAFEALEIKPECFPAASALGHMSKGAVFYVFASASKPQHFKNNKQVNAYDYPRQYGISSPSFARATGLTLAASPYLFISGTASIVGHKTIEAENLERQLEVTASNIEYLLTNANPDNRTLSTFKVYVRHLHHIEQTKKWLDKHYPQVATVITIADICRSDLLVEIECFCH
jgi:chorismate lyase/3-hydroxybenzoate synthase